MPSDSSWQGLLSVGLFLGAVGLFGRRISVKRVAIQASQTHAQQLRLKEQWETLRRQPNRPIPPGADPAIWQSFDAYQTYLSLEEGRRRHGPSNRPPDGAADRDAADLRLNRLAESWHERGRSAKRTYYMPWDATTQEQFSRDFEARFSAAAAMHRKRWAGTSSESSVPFGAQAASIEVSAAERSARATLGLPLTAVLSADQVKTAFKEAAKLAHPDASTGNADRFRAVVSAQEVLATALGQQHASLRARSQTPAEDPTIFRPG